MLPARQWRTNTPAFRGPIHSIGHLSAVVVVTLFAKSVAKVAAGIFCHIPSLLFDGIRGSFDITKHIVIRLVGHHARARPDENFPLGKRALFPLITIALAVASLVLGWTMLSEIVQTSLLLVHQHLHQLPEWISFLFEGEHKLPGSTRMLVTGSIVMLGSGILTHLVTSAQARFAELNQFPELLAEAEDNSGTAVMEVSVSGCLLITALASYIHVGEPTTIYQISVVISLILVFWILIRGAIQVLKSAANELVSPSLETSQAEQIRIALRNELPRGVELKAPIVAFRHTTAVFVSLRLEISTGLLAASHSIARRAKILTESFLRDDYSPVRVDVTCEQIDEENVITRQIDQMLRVEWNLTSDTSESAAIRQCLLGDLKGATRLLNDSDPSADRSFAWRWVALWVALYGKGPNSEETARAVVPLAESLAVGGLSKSCTAFFQSLSLIALSQGGANDGRIVKTAAQAAHLANLVSGNELDCLAKAEAYFALGIYHQQVKSNAEEALSLYGKAELFYLEGGYSTFADRLYTSWGHLLTLCFRLGPARVLLEDACKLKIKKGDNLGLSFSYGCLADCLSRNACYDEADSNYDKDIQICEDHGLGHFVPGIRLKKALNYYRRGAAILSAYTLDDLNECRSLANNIIQTEHSSIISQWFAHKEIIKCLLFEHLVATTPDRQKECLDSAEKHLHALTDFGSRLHLTEYFRGIHGVLSARLHARKGDWTSAASSMRRSLDIMGAVYGASGESALVPLTFRIETETYAMFAFGDPEPLKAAIQATIAYRDSQRGYLDNLNSLIAATTERLLEDLATLDRNAARQRWLISCGSFVAVIEP